MKSFIVLSFSLMSFLAFSQVEERDYCLGVAKTENGEIAIEFFSLDDYKYSTISALKDYHELTLVKDEGKANEGQIYNTGYSPQYLTMRWELEMKSSHTANLHIYMRSPEVLRLSLN